jgi:hypothetical protein
VAIFVSTVEDYVLSPKSRSLPESAGGAATASGSAGSAAAEPFDSPSMAEPVTRHAQNPPVSDFQFLLCGIDTLDLGLFVSWDTAWDTTKAYLAEKKEEAQCTSNLLCKTDIGREFLFLPGGKAPNYRFHLQFPEYHVYIAISDQFGNSPNVYVSFLAETLWHVELSAVLELLEFDLSFLGGKIERIQPSRCDLCADFKISPPPNLDFIQQHRVSRSHKNRPWLDGDILETFICGSPDSPVQIRIYDKGKEIQKTNKQWFLPLWGVDTPEGVWRVEFQLRRTFLRQYRVNTIENLWQDIAAIWDYLTGEWFSLRIPDNEKTERRTIHPWWLLAQECRDRFGDMSDARRTFTTDTVEPIQHALAHICGRLVSIAAQKGIKDRQKAISHLCKLINVRMDDEKFKSEYKIKSIKLGYRGRFGGTDNDSI